MKFVMTSSVYHGEIISFLIEMILIKVMEFNLFFETKVKSTVRAFPVLAFKKEGFQRGKFRIRYEPCTPISPIPIVWGTASFDFNMSVNRRFIMSVERLLPTAEDPSASRIDQPIAGNNPITVIERMPSFCPSK
jgi:hypothetical protein